MESPIATPRNTYAKRQRDQEKKYRADQKRLKRAQKKDMVKTAAPPEDLSTFPPTAPPGD